MWTKFTENLIPSFVFLVIFVLTLVLAYRIDNAFRIQGMNVIGESKDIPFQGKNQYRGRYLWHIDLNDVKTYLSNANPYYRINSIRKEYPSTIDVEVSRLIPTAYLTVGDGFFLLSSEGIVLEKVRDAGKKDIPVITFYQNVPYNSFQRGDEIGFKEVEDSLYFLGIIQDARIKVNSIDIEGFHMLGLYTDSSTFLFTSAKDSELQKYQFEQSLKQLSVEGITFDILDVRFDKPVIRF